MLFQIICAFLLKLIINIGKVSSSEQCTQFSIQFYKITDLDKIDQFERGSFGILNNLTKQCGSLNIAIEIDLYREEKKSRLYKELYGDDLHKLTVTYPLDDNVTEEIESPPECYNSETKEPQNFPIYEYIPINSRDPYDNENTHDAEPTTHNTDYTTKDILESTAEPETTEMNNISYSGDPDKFTNKKNDNKVAIIVFSTLAGVASITVVSYFVYYGIKTILQSGTFRFPDA